MKESSQTRANELPFSPPQHGLPKTAIPQLVYTRQREIPERSADEMSAYYSDSSLNSTTAVEENVQSGDYGVSKMTPLHFEHRTLLPQTPITGGRTVPQMDDDEMRYDSYPSNDVIEEYIERGLLSLNKDINDQEATQKIVFQLITRARLTTEVFRILREKDLPSSISEIKWVDVASRFLNLKTLNFRVSNKLRCPAFPKGDVIYLDFCATLKAMANRYLLLHRLGIHLLNMFGTIEEF